MTKQQLAIAVAEKVWGEIWTFEDGSPIDELFDAVFSWAGFGRTVSSMNNPGMPSALRHKYVAPYSDYLGNNISKEELWEATHQAALSTLDSEVRDDK